ncbi:HopJ type III effector protein [Porticoccaceae bacterium LTM1]|nr:HopJ type III effector protein [Porticoccaceae bacterium LTM1]
MALQTFIDRLNSSPQFIEFGDTMAVIDSLYLFTPTAFQNGELHNAADQNNGSCKLFAFARAQNLSEEQTLACFGAFYRDDVLKDPDGSSHQNIRNFMRSGWAGVQFEGEPLAEK